MRLRHGIPLIKFPFHFNFCTYIFYIIMQCDHTRHAIFRLYIYAQLQFTRKVKYKINKKNEDNAIIVLFVRKRSIHNLERSSRYFRPIKMSRTRFVNYV